MKKSMLFIISFLIIILLSINSLAACLEQGDRGNDILEVQKLLSELGYNIKADGIFGYRTKETIKDFQYNNGLKVDGIVGNNTFDLLKKTAEDIEYTVKKGDTLFEIAKDYDTTVSDIRKHNELSSDKIIIGQKIMIPKTGIGGGEESKIYARIIHEVQKGDALSILARKYGSSIETIKLANNLKSNRIYVGQNLVIPHLTRGASQNFKLARGSLIWPVLGRISSPYGWRIHPINKTRQFHRGIDIAVPVGTKIRAVAGGKVIQAGWLGGFGYTVIIDHGQGIETLYAHNSRLLVRAGRNVKMGEVISLAGSTGTSTGSHLHFGLIVNEKAINPAKYLP